MSEAQAQTEVVHLHTPPPAAPEEKKTSSKRSESKRTAAPVKKTNAVKRPTAAKKVTAKTSAKKATSKNEAKRNAREAGHKAQTQVPMDLWTLISKRAKTEKVRQADVVRKALFTYFKYKPAA